MTFSLKLIQKIIAKLVCNDYGFGCSFETKENEIDKVIEEFRNHTFQEHHIDYNEGILMKFIMRKKIK